MKVIVHLGYPKSMSTYYQKYIFPYFADVEYVGLFPTNNLGYREEKVSKKETLLNTWIADILDERIGVKDLRDRLNNINGDSEMIILSYERILSPFFNDMSLDLAVNRIKQIFEEDGLYFLVLFRSLSEFVVSQYREQPFIYRGNSKTFVRMEKWLEYYEKKGLYYSPSDLRVIVGDDLFEVNMSDKEAAINIIEGIFETRFVGSLSAETTNIGVSGIAFFIRRLVVVKLLSVLLPKRVKQFVMSSLSTGKSKSIKLPLGVQRKLKSYEASWYTTSK